MSTKGRERPRDDREKNDWTISQPTSAINWMVTKRVTCCALLRKVDRSIDIPISCLIGVEMIYIKYVSKRGNDDNVFKRLFFLTVAA